MTAEKEIKLAELKAKIYNFQFIDLQANDVHEHPTLTNVEISQKICELIFELTEVDYIFPVVFDMGNIQLDFELHNAEWEIEIHPNSMIEILQEPVDKDSEQMPIVFQIDSFGNIATIEHFLTTPQFS